VLDSYLSNNGDDNDNFDYDNLDNFYDLNYFESFDNNFSNNYNNDYFLKK